MDTRSVESNFVFSGPEGPLAGDFEWSEEDTVLGFEPRRALERNAGYILNIGAAAESKGGVALGEEYGAFFTTFDQFAVTGTNVEPYSVLFTFSSPLPQDDADKFVTVSPALENFSTGVSEDGLSLSVYGLYEPETSYSIELSGDLQDGWGQPLGEPFAFNFLTAPANPMLYAYLYTR